MPALDQEMFKKTFKIEGRVLDAILYDAELEVERLQKDLAGSIASARHRFDQTLESLEKHGTSPNSLGILQSSGPDIDRLCGQLDTAKRAVTRIKTLIAGTEEIE